MSDVDIYDETENLISSDEYSEDDDDLMNAAISSQHTSKSELVESNLSKRNKIEEIKLLVKRKECSSIYKKRSIKWLNNKSKREKYKQYLLNVIKTKRGTSVPGRDIQIGKSNENIKKSTSVVKRIEETVHLGNTDIENFPIKKVTSLKDNCQEENFEGTEEVILKKVKSKCEESISAKHKVESCEALTEENATLVSKTSSNKRNRSPSPILEINVENASKKHEPDRTNSVPLYKEINEMFSKYDAVVGNHIKSTNSTLEAVEENVTRILVEIQTLNDILQTKEIEWNRLLHLKKVKEEILTRLVRKKHIIELHKRREDEPKYSMSELKELEQYLSDPNTSHLTQVLPSTTQKLVENRANMRREDLERERSNTNRLQSILVSSNILQRIETSNKNFDIKDKNLSHSSPSANSHQTTECRQYFDNKINANIGRQGPFTDVKSLISDFRQRNPDMQPRVGKRCKMNESESSLRILDKSGFASNHGANSLSIEASYDSGGANSSSTLEKLLSTSRGHDVHPKRSMSYTQGFKFNTERPNTCYRVQHSGVEPCHEVSITPIASDSHYSQKDYEYKSELLRTALNTKLRQNDGVEYGKLKFMKAENNAPENEVPICQECKSHESRFVCGGCGNQWYCSRRCQITAWDKHSETCNE